MSQTYRESGATVLTRIPELAGPRLNLGCGPIQPDTWVNIDSSHRAKLVRLAPRLNRVLVALGVLPPTEFKPTTRTHNLSNRLAFGDESVVAIYSGELLEHLVPMDADRLLSECFRVLKPGGMLRVRVPDSLALWKKY